MEKLKVAIYGTNGHQITQKLKNGTKTQWVAAAGIPKEIIEQERGSIMDHNGRLLAISTPLYNIRIHGCCPFLMF